MINGNVEARPLEPEVARCIKRIRIMSPALETQRHSKDANDNQTRAWRTSDDARDTDTSRTMKWLGYSETNSSLFWNKAFESFFEGWVRKSEYSIRRAELVQSKTKKAWYNKEIGNATDE